MAEPAIAPRTPLHRNPYLWAFLIGCATLTLMRPLLRRVPEPPPVLGQLPPFTLVDQDNRPFGSAELRGQPYVASFFFTRCVSICPKLMQSVATLQERYRTEGVEGIRLVSVSVDPEADTPARLRAYAARMGVDPARWTLLTGDPPTVQKVVEGGFKTAMGPADDAGSVLDIAHSGKLVLVDGMGRIRGYYDSDTGGLDEVFYRSQHIQ